VAVLRGRCSKVIGSAAIAAPKSRNFLLSQIQPVSISYFVAIATENRGKSADTNQKYE